MNYFYTLIVSLVLCLGISCAPSEPKPIEETAVPAVNPGKITNSAPQFNPSLSDKPSSESGADVSSKADTGKEDDKLPTTKPAGDKTTSTPPPSTPAATKPPATPPTSGAKPDLKPTNPPLESVNPPGITNNPSSNLNLNGLQYCASEGGYVTPELAATLNCGSSSTPNSLSGQIYCPKLGGYVSPADFDLFCR